MWQVNSLRENVLLTSMSDPQGSNLPKGSASHHHVCFPFVLLAMHAAQPDNF
jgi:hypothetical protein